MRSVGHNPLSGAEFHSVLFVFCVFVCSMASADSNAVALTTNAIDGAVKGLDRPSLVRALGLPFDVPLVADIVGLHPVSLFAPKTLKISRALVPFMEAGTATECCSAATLMRMGHTTVAIPCYATNLASGDSACPHCTEVWALANDDNVFEVTKDMHNAWSFYKKGTRSVMRRWAGWKQAEKLFMDEVAAAKETFNEGDGKLADG